MSSAEKEKQIQKESIRLINDIAADNYKDTLENVSSEAVHNVLTKIVEENNSNYFDNVVEQIDSKKLTLEQWRDLYLIYNNHNYNQNIDQNNYKIISKIYSYDLSKEFQTEAKFLLSSFLYGYFNQTDLNFQEKFKNILTQNLDDHTLYSSAEKTGFGQYSTLKVNGTPREELIASFDYQKYISKTVLPIILEKKQNSNISFYESRFSILTAAALMNWNIPQEAEIASEVLKLPEMSMALEEIKNEYRLDTLIKTFRKMYAPPDIQDKLFTKYKEAVIKDDFHTRFHPPHTKLYVEWINKIYYETGQKAEGAKAFRESLPVLLHDTSYMEKINYNIINDAIADANATEIINMAMINFYPKKENEKNGVDYDGIINKIIQLHPDLQQLEKILIKNESKLCSLVSFKIKEYILDHIDINEPKHISLFLKYGSEIPGIEFNDKVERLKEIVEYSLIDENNYDLLAENFYRYNDKKLNTMIFDFFFEKQKNNLSFDNEKVEDYHILKQNPKLFFNLVVSNYTSIINNPDQRKKLFTFLSSDFQGSDKYFNTINEMFYYDSKSEIRTIIEYRQHHSLEKSTIETRLNDINSNLSIDKRRMLIKVSKSLTD